MKCLLCISLPTTVILICPAPGPQQPHTLLQARGVQLGSCSGERDWGLTDGYTRQQCAQVTKGILAYIKNSLASKSRKEFVSVYLLLVRLHLKHCVQLCVTHFKKDIEVLEFSQRGQRRWGRG